MLQQKDIYNTPSWSPILAMVSSPNTIASSAPSPSLCDELDPSSERAGVQSVLAAIMGLTSLGGAPISPTNSSSISIPSLSDRVGDIKAAPAPYALSPYMGNSPEEAHNKKIKIELALAALEKPAATKPTQKSPPFCSTTAPAYVAARTSAFKTKLSSWPYSFTRNSPDDLRTPHAPFDLVSAAPSYEDIAERAPATIGSAAPSLAGESLPHHPHRNDATPLCLPSPACRSEWWDQYHPTEPALGANNFSTEKNFPEILLEVISAKEYSDVISWLPHGRGFAIMDKRRFVDEILPRHFDGAKFASFTRRLKRWNFVRVPRGPELGAYYNEKFLRDKPELVQQLMYHNDGRCEDGKKKKNETKSEGKVQKQLSDKDQGWLNDKSNELPSQEEHKQPQEHILTPANIPVQEAQLNTKSQRKSSQEECRQLKQIIISTNAPSPSLKLKLKHRCSTNEQAQIQSIKGEDQLLDELHRLPSQEEYGQLQRGIRTVGNPCLNLNNRHSTDPQPRDAHMPLPSSLPPKTKHSSVKKRVKHTVGTSAKKAAKDAAIIPGRKLKHRYLADPQAQIQENKDKLQLIDGPRGLTALSSQEKFKHLQQIFLSASNPLLEPKTWHSPDPPAQDGSMPLPRCLPKKTKNFSAKKRTKHTVGTSAKTNAREDATIRKHVKDLENRIVLSQLSTSATSHPGTMIPNDLRQRSIEMLAARSEMSRLVVGGLATSHPAGTAAFPVQCSAVGGLSSRSYRASAFDARRAIVAEYYAQTILEASRDPGYHHESHAMQARMNNPREEFGSFKIPSSFNPKGDFTEGIVGELDSRLVPYFAQSMGRQCNSAQGW